MATKKPKKTLTANDALRLGAELTARGRKKTRLGGGVTFTGPTLSLRKKGT